MYSVVRHPLYLANYIIVIGFAMELHVWWLVLLCTCGYALYYERIMLAEEAFLRKRFGDAFEQWAAVTPAFIPRFRAWKPSQVPFCWRTVLQREYNAFFLIIAVFFLLDLIGDSFVERRLKIDPGWFVMFVGGFVFLPPCARSRNATHLLTVEGRGNARAKKKSCGVPEILDFLFLERVERARPLWNSIPMKLLPAIFFASGCCPPWLGRK